MTITLQKIEALRTRLVSGEPKGGALIVVYPPEDELVFQSGYVELIQELTAKKVLIHSLNFRTLVFDVLEQRNLLQKAFQLDAADSRDIRQNLAGMVQREAQRRLHAAASEAPNAMLFCIHTASLYPWVSYSALLEEIENNIPNILVLPFPGTEKGATLHFLGAKDGYNYRAVRV
jgi:hypothetical protein